MFKAYQSSMILSLCLALCVTGCGGGSGASGGGLSSDGKPADTTATARPAKPLALQTLTRDMAAQAAPVEAQTAAERNNPAIRANHVAFNIALGATQAYALTPTPGVEYTVTVTTESGDADLYGYIARAPVDGGDGLVQDPFTTGFRQQNSINVDLVPDSITFTPPSPATCFFLVNGFKASTYRIQVATGTAGAIANLEVIGGQSLAINETRVLRFRATNGSGQEIAGVHATDITWSSATTSIVTFNAATGAATGVAAGVSAVTASLSVNTTTGAPITSQATNVIVTQTSVFRVTASWESNGDFDLHTWNATDGAVTSHIAWFNRTTAFGTQDRDDITGRGPENHFITRTGAGRYRIAVNNFGHSTTTPNVTVRVVSGAMSSNPGSVDQVFGPQFLPTANSGGALPVTVTTTSWWRVCDVDVDANNRVSILPASHTDSLRSRVLSNGQPLRKP